MKKWNPFYALGKSPPVPVTYGAEWSVLNHQVTETFPQPIPTGNMWTRQLVPAPLEGHFVTYYHEHPEVWIQAGFNNNDEIILAIQGKEVGNI